MTRREAENAIQDILDSDHRVDVLFEIINDGLTVSLETQLEFLKLLKSELDSVKE